MFKSSQVHMYAELCPGRGCVINLMKGLKMPGREVLEERRRRFTEASREHMDRPWFFNLLFTTMRSINFRHGDSDNEL
jgi:hypothetical protein